jgi:hypothetical protein
MGRLRPINPVAFVWVIAGVAVALWWVLKLASSRWPARQGSAFSSVDGPSDPAVRIVDCAHCGQRNRLRQPTGTPRFRCGKCRKSLPNPFPPPPPITAEPAAWFRPSAAPERFGGIVSFRDLPTEERSVKADDLKDVVDAFTGEGLKPALGIFQCLKCQVFYHRASYEMLKTENGGQCVACLAVSIRPLSVFAPRPDFRSASAETSRERSGEDGEPVTLINFRERVGQVVCFQGFVPRVLASPSGGDIAMMFQDRAWAEGFKAVVLRSDVEALGGEPFLRNLAGRTLRVRGLVQMHPEFGYQMVLTRRAMIEDIR